jgi:hypothetical protein
MPSCRRGCRLLDGFVRCGTIGNEMGDFGRKIFLTCLFIVSPSPVEEKKKNIIISRVSYRSQCKDLLLGLHQHKLRDVLKEENISWESLPIMFLPRSDVVGLLFGKRLMSGP